jgi:hypothetical protein
VGDLGRDEFEVIRSFQIECLQVEPGDAVLGESTYPVDHLSRGTGQIIYVQIVRSLSDRCCATGELGVVAADTAPAPPNRRSRDR